MRNVIYKSLFSIILNVFVISNVLAQTDNKQDTVKTVIKTNRIDKEIITDTLGTDKLSPLDISKSRGLYILTHDGMMQLRILGSVRFSALYDFVELPVKNTFSTFEIPTGSDNYKILNYYNSLSWTRIGFEITRKTNKGNVFIRIETDFAGQDGSFRIRHAYGQMGKYLIGQTWSLLTNVSDLPITVDPNGPTGSVVLRTPQIRYSSQYDQKYNWAVGLEYSQIDLDKKSTDTAEISTVQRIPDFTARIGTQGNLGSIQFAAIVNIISTKDAQSSISNSFGYGGSLSGKIILTKIQELYFQLTSGKSIAHFISTFSGMSHDAVINPQTNKIESFYSLGGFLSYGYFWSKKISTHFSFGLENIFNKSYQPDNAFRNSISITIDAFWNIIEGARIGINYSYGQRWDKGGTTGRASRIWTLFYYDF